MQERPSPRPRVASEHYDLLPGPLGAALATPRCQPRPLEAALRGATKTYRPSVVPLAFDQRAAVSQQVIQRIRALHALRSVVAPTRRASDKSGWLDHLQFDRRPSELSRSASPVIALQHGGVGALAA